MATSTMIQIDLDETGGDLKINHRIHAVSSHFGVEFGEHELILMGSNLHIFTAVLDTLAEAISDMRRDIDAEVSA